MSEKLHFVLNTFPSLVRMIDPSTKGLWGKMNVQQMIEHMSDSIREANGNTPRVIITEADRLPKMKEFLMSEKEFKPETKNALMGPEPLPVRNISIEAAILELESELKYFEKHYKENPSSIITNPFFGDLNFEEWTQLIHKHAVHHLKQFGSLD